MPTATWYLPVVPTPIWHLQSLWRGGGGGGAGRKEGRKEGSQEARKPGSEEADS